MSELTTAKEAASGLRRLAQDFLAPEMREVRVRLDALEQRVERFEKAVDARFDKFEHTVDVRFDKFEHAVDARFNKFENTVDTRFDKVEKLIQQSTQQSEERINAKIGELLDALRLDARLENVERKLTEHPPQQ